MEGKGIYYYINGDVQTKLLQEYEASKAEEE